MTCGSTETSITPIRLDHQPVQRQPGRCGWRRNEYFVLGDNSPISEDSRNWRGPAAVDANLLVGKPLVSIDSILVSPWPGWLFQVPNPAAIRYIHQRGDRGQRSGIRGQGIIMANRKYTGPKPRPVANPQPAGGIHHRLPSAAAIRETVESIVVAFVLAFLFRTFEAEAFVIPTGSMAPTLMGRHKDVTCPRCGYPYQVSASEEVNPEGRDEQSADRTGTCPMCRYTAMLGPATSSYNGDRILVDKFPTISARRSGGM